MQAKRVQINEQNLGAGGQVDVELIVPDSPREQINFHNIWIGATVEPQNAGANCQGTWLLWNRRKDVTAITFTDAEMNTEDQLANIVACGVYSASNESVWTLPPTQVKTSRNLNAGDRLVLSIVCTGITAGLASIRGILCAHTVRS